MRLWVLHLFVALLCASAVPSLAQPTLRIVAFDGSDLKGAHIRVSTPDGRVYNFTLDPGNPFIVGDTVRGELIVEVVSWKNVPVHYQARVTVYNYVTLVVPNIGKLTLKVSGARGQALERAFVKIMYNGQTVEVGVTGAGGLYSSLLPAGVYKVIVERGGRMVFGTFVAWPSRETIVNSRLDVFLSFDGTDLSTSNKIRRKVRSHLVQTSAGRRSREL